MTTKGAYELLDSDRGLTIPQRLCRHGKHKLRQSLTGMSHWCERPGCGYEWELD